jgi:hypothetical protein
MQRNDLHFLFSELPDRSTQKLLCSYLSLFGEVENCEYDALGHRATVSFSASDDPDKILNARHRFLGMPIVVNRVPTAGAAAAVASALPLDSSASIASPAIAPSDFCVAPSPCDSKPAPAPPGNCFRACFSMSCSSPHPLPEHFCDMTFACDVMDDPVVAADGFTYEREAITQWLASHSTSPTTNEPMHSKVVFPNVSIRAQIIAWRELHGLPMASNTCSVPVPSSSRARVFSSTAASSSLLKSSAAVCPTHPNEPLRAFCITCKKSICSDCAVDTTLCKLHVTRSVSSIITQLQSEHAIWQQVHAGLPEQNQVRHILGYMVSFRARIFNCIIAGADRPR